MTSASLAPLPVATHHTNSYNAVTLGFGLPSYETGPKNIALRVFVIFAKKMFDEFCLKVINAKLVRDFKN